MEVEVEHWITLVVIAVIVVGRVSEPSDELFPVLVTRMNAAVMLI